ncbi:ion transporter [Nocardia sp. NPDC049149]|uniref:ion transporter n=1 Tax=Nocardia sp. NPDC049149 TaxID=3364315 RepID=UPI00371175EF
MLTRESARSFVESSQCQRLVVAVILLNAAALGAETSEWLMAIAGRSIHLVDTVALGIFVLEMLLKLYAYGPSYFRDPWNFFDFLVIGVALVPASGGLSVLRAFRILRVLRLVSVSPSMRRVVANLLAAMPGMGSILGLLALVLYVAAVMATKLFGAVTPEYFGSLGTSMWTLFQVMTGEAWPDIARTVMAEKPLAWIFFLVYILVSTFVVLNLFLAVMVSAAEDVRAADDHGPKGQDSSAESASYATILGELTALRAEVNALRLGARAGAPDARRQLSDVELAHAVILYRNGHPLAHIANRLGVTHETIRTTLQRRAVLRHR